MNVLLEKPPSTKNPPIFNGHFWPKANLQNIAAYTNASTTTCLTRPATTFFVPQIKKKPVYIKNKSLSDYNYSIANLWRKVCLMFIKNPTFTFKIRLPNCCSGYDAGIPIKESLVENRWVAPESTHPFILPRSIKLVSGIPGDGVVKVERKT